MTDLNALGVAAFCENENQSKQVTLAGMYMRIYYKEETVILITVSSWGNIFAKPYVTLEWWKILNMRPQSPSLPLLHEEKPSHLNESDSQIPLS